jgi:hypothetical protein
VARTRRKTRLQRVARSTIVVLLLALLNWPIGWICANFFEPTRFTTRIINGVELESLAKRFKGKGMPESTGELCLWEGWGDTSTQLRVPPSSRIPDADRGEPLWVFRESAFGWPARSIGVESTVSDDHPQRPAQTRLSDSPLMGVWFDASWSLYIKYGNRGVWLPLLPRPFGLMLNRAAFIAAFGLCRHIVIRFRAPSSYQCSSCRYDLRGAPSSICPECGSPFDRSAISPKLETNAIDSNS